MPLKIEMKSGDKLMINGAVVENVGPSTRILVHNESAILRHREVLSDAESNTPAARVYFALQCAYAFPDKREDYLTAFAENLRQYVGAAPSAAPIAAAIMAEIEAGRLYKALKTSQRLIQHEAKTLTNFRKMLESRISEGVGEDAAAPSPVKGKA